MIIESGTGEDNIKQKIIAIIRSFRSLGFLNPSDVKIDELEEIDSTYRITGDYNYKGIYLNQDGEKGSFVITLDKDLKPKKVKITPQSHV